jgi:glycosyltransferase involved in cell wall biosynthesis
MKLKKILIIGSLPPPLHGASVYFKNIVDNEELRKDIKIKSLNVTVNENISTLTKFSIKKVLLSLMFYIRLIIILIFNRINVVYMQVSYPVFAFLKDSVFILILKLFGKKIIGAVLGTGYKEIVENKSSLLFWYYRFIFKRYNSFLTPSIYMLTNDGFSKEMLGKSKELPFAINPINHSMKSIEKVNLPYQILFMGNLHPGKGIFECLECVSYVVKEVKEVKFVFAGEWSSEEDEVRAKKIVKKNRISPYCKIAATISGDDKKRYLEESHIFLLPTYYHSEGFPLALLDAMSFGLYIITTQHAAIPSVIIDSFNGAYCKPKDPHDLADKIVLALKNKSSMKRIRQQAIKSFYSNYTYSVFINRFKDYLKEY